MQLSKTPQHGAAETTLHLSTVLVAALALAGQRSLAFSSRPRIYEQRAPGL